MARQTFRRAQKLLQATEFKTVFDGSCRVGNRWLTVLASPSPVEHPRLGLAIAKRRVRLSCRRNRVKRIVRESFRLNQHRLQALDFVVLAGPAAAQAAPPQLRRAIDELWPRVIKRCAEQSSS